MKTSGFVFKAELGGLLKLSLPIIFTQFIQVSNTTVAILMMGRVGSVELAALGLGGSFMILVFLVCLGVMMALSPTIAQHFGAGRKEGIRSAYQHGLWLAGVTSLAAYFLLRQMRYHTSRRRRRELGIYLRALRSIASRRRRGGDEPGACDDAERLGLVGVCTHFGALPGPEPVQVISVARTGMPDFVTAWCADCGDAGIGLRLFQRHCADDGKNGPRLARSASGSN